MTDRFKKLLAGFDIPHASLVVPTGRGNSTAVWRKMNGRYFTFAKGAIFSGNGMHARPDVELVWVSVPVAFKALASGDDKQVMTALGRSQLSIQGNLDHFFWFAEVMEAMTAG